GRRAEENAGGAATARKNRAAERDMRRVRSLAKTNPEAVAQAVAKVAPQALIDAATEAQGRTRSAAPSNQAKVEEAFGPREFNRLEDAIEAMVERLPDLAVNREDKKYA